MKPYQPKGPLEPWPRRQSEPLGDFRIFSVRRDIASSPRTGGDHSFFILDAGQWINIVPVTEDDQVVLIEQYRHGIQDFTLEIPGGLAESHEDDLAEAAGRELLEETGYQAAEIVSLGSCHPNPAMQSNLCHFFLGKGCRKVADLNLDDGEDIHVVTYPVAQIPELVAAGHITHSLVLAALYRFALR
ncbi:MAG: NUDIX hydrolase [Planctomycetota bacterium]